MTLIERATQYFKNSFKKRDEATIVGVEMQDLQQNSAPRPTLQGVGEDEADQGPRHNMIIQDLNSDDESVPIPETTLAEICRDEVSLGDFSKMRIFKTLFSEEGIPLGLKGQFMKKLVNICKCS